MVCFCTIECDFSKPIPESRYEPNRLLCEDIRAWGAMTDKLYVWDYTTNFGNYLHQFPNLNALQGNIRFFLRHGCYSLFEQGPYQGTYADFSSLKLWLLSKWMWNPDLDRETLLKEFFEGFYGPAAAEMRAYLDLCHAQPRDETKNPLTLALHPTDPVFTEEFYDRAEALVEKALAKADPKSIYARNVAIAYASVAYSRMIRTWRKNVGRKFLLSRDPKVCNAAVRLNEWAKLVEAAVKDGARLSEFHNRGRLIDLERSLAAKPRAQPAAAVLFVRAGDGHARRRVQSPPRRAAQVRGGARLSATSTRLSPVPRLPLADADFHLDRFRLAPVLAKSRGEAIWDVCGTEVKNTLAQNAESAGTDPVKSRGQTPSRV